MKTIPQTAIDPQPPPGPSPQDPARVRRPNPAIALVYGCGCVRVEHRGRMSETVRAEVIASCQARKCPACTARAERVTAALRGARGLEWGEE